MYELDGKQYTLEQIQTLLNEENYKGGIDDFIAEKGYTKVSSSEFVNTGTEDNKNFLFGPFAGQQILGNNPDSENLNNLAKNFVLKNSSDPTYSLNEEEKNIYNDFINIEVSTDDAIKEIREQYRDAFKNYPRVQMSLFGVTNLDKDYYKRVEEFFEQNPYITQKNVDDANEFFDGVNIKDSNGLESFIETLEITPEQLEKEKEILKKNARVDFLSDVDNETRINISKKITKNLQEQAELLGYSYSDVEGLLPSELLLSESGIIKEINNLAEIDDKNNIIGGEIYDINKNINEIEKVLGEEFEKNTLTPEKLNNYILELEPLYEKQVSLVKKHEDLVTNYLGATKNLISDAEAVDFFKRNYTNIYMAKESLKTAGLDVARGFYDLGTFLDYMIGPEGFLNFKGYNELSRFNLENLNENEKAIIENKKWFENKAEELQLEKQAFGKPIITLDEIRNFGDFLRYSNDTLFEQVPYTLAAILPTKWATTLFGLSGLGGKAIEMGLNEKLFENIDLNKLEKLANDETIPEAERKFAQDQLHLYENEVSKGQLKKLFVGSVYGVAEFLPSKAFGQIQRWQAIKQILKKGNKTTISRQLAEFGKDVGFNTLDEGVTQFLQNSADIIAFDKNISYFENMDESMVKGLIGSVQFAGPRLAAGVYGTFVNMAQTKQDKQIMEGKYAKLQNYLDELAKLDGRTAAAKAINKEVTILKNEILILQDLSLNRLKELDPSEIIELGDIGNEKRKIIKEFESIKNSKTLDQKTLKELYNVYKNRIQVLNNKKTDILGKVTRTTEVDLQDLSMDEKQNIADNSGYLFSGVPFNKLKETIVTATRKNKNRPISLDSIEIEGEVLTETVEAPLTKKEQREKKREEKQKQKEKEKEKKKANELASDYDNLDAAGVQELLKQYQSIALDALQYKPNKGSVTPEDAIAFVNAEFSSIMDRFDPNEAQFSTWVTANIAPKAPSLYGTQEKLEEAGQTTSLDDERAQQVADPSTVEVTETVTTETVKPSTVVFEGETQESQYVGAINASDTYKNKIEGKEIIENEINVFNELAETVGAPILAQELGVPVEVIIDPKLNINNTHNPSNLQRFVLKNSQLLLNTLKANTNVEVVGSLKNPEVKIKVGGKPLKLPRKLLELFFEKTNIRVGNNFQYKLKPGLTIKDIQESVGIKNGKLDPDYVNRSGQAQTLKALLLTLARIRTNAALEGITEGKVAGQVISTQSPKTKTATERAIDYLTKKEAEFKNITLVGIPPNAIISTLKGALKLYNGSNIQAVVNYIKNKLREFSSSAANAISRIFANNILKSRNKVIDQVLAWSLASSGDINSVLKAAKLEGIYDLKDPKQRKKYKEELRTKIFPLMPKAFWGNLKMFASEKNRSLNIPNSELRSILDSMDDSEFGAPIEGVTDYTRRTYKSVFGTTGKSTLDVLNSDKGKEFNKNNSLIWSELLKRINDLVKNDKESARAIGNWLKGVGTDTTHWFKTGAEVLGADPNSTSLHWEHAMPASAAYRYLVNAMLNPNIDFNTTLELIKNNYKVIAVDTKDNKKIDKAKLKTEMPSWWTIFDNWFDRYFNSQVASIDGGINPNSIQLADGKTLGEAFNIDNSSGTSAVQNIEAQINIDNTLDNGDKALETESVKKKLNDIKKEDEKDLSKDFNIIIEENKGVRAEAVYSDIVARRKGRGIGRFKFFLPPGAEDFKGLIYEFLGQGKKGEQQFEFFNNNLIKPYQQAVAQIERFRRSLSLDYSALLKINPEARVLLNKKIPSAEYSYDQAVRAYLMDQSGFDLADTGLSKRDAKLLVDTIKNNPIMLNFANGLQLITKQDTWLKPNGGFDVQTIQSDLHRLTSGEGRKRFLNNSGFMQNSGEIFSKNNLNKIEAVYGRGVREALEDVLYRMKNGTNRPSGTNRLTNQFNNWVNRSIGAIMFFNRKSALLQTISSVNFINWSDNNPLKAAAAFANQKQYWSDFAFIFNSPKLKERRRGLKGDINEAELASAVQGATNKAEAALSWLLKQGFLPTQMADSFAIASGGATFYRNRVNTYVAQGMDQQAAEKKAFEDFSTISEESQQSADPSMISEQQASPLGRLILAFQNTPMQYTRLMKRASQDLINGRGDWKTNVSKIIYYGAIQNFIFAGLQNALFAVIPGFDDEEENLEEETKKQQANQNKNIRIINNMVDTILRGSGIYGAIGATIKNTAIKFYQNEQKDPFAKDNADIILEAINLSPPIGSKLRKLNNALKTREFEKNVIEERGWEITRDGRLNLSPSYRVFGSTVEAVANVPLERIIAEIDALVEMTDSRNSAMERIALGLGWRTWDLGVKNEEHDQIELEVKERKKREKEEERKRKREEEKRLKEEARFEGLTNKEINALKREDQIKALTRQQQVDSLLKLGVSKKEIRSLRYEEDRIKKIIELNTK